MADKHDKFQLLKSKYLAEVRETESGVSELKAKLIEIEELETESESLNGAVVSNGKYQNLGLTEYVLDAVQTLGVGGGVSTTNIAKHLISQGFQTKGKNFMVSVGTTLKRLAIKQKKIQTILKDGNRLYMP